MPLQAINDAVDGTTVLGTGSAGIGFAATFAQYYPIVTGTMAFIIMIMTITHVYRKITNSKLDERIKIQQIELNDQKHQRRKDDPKP